jgi:nucleoside-diphosphate kinase
MEKQKALIIIKSDGVQRGLMGKIIQRFENVGLTIIGFKFEWADKKKIIAHYPDAESWYAKVGQRTLSNYAKKGLNAKELLGTDNDVEIGKMVKGWLIDYLQESPVLIMAVEGYDCIEIVRKISGNTVPLLAAPGTIRGDFSHHSIDVANETAKPLRNIIHASDAVEDGIKEVNLWFDKDELFEQTRADEHILMGFKK